MLLSDLSIKRPVMAIVLSLLLTLFGLVAFSKLSVRELPDVDVPVVSVSVSYEGASAAVMEDQITKPIEDQLSGISGIDTIESVSRNGSTQITVNFDLDWDIMEGLSDVRDAVSRAQRSLPEDADDPMVLKSNVSGDAVVRLSLRSAEMDRIELTDYAERVLVDRLSLVNGVSQVSLYGDLERVVYLQLDPSAMAGRGISVAMVESALNNQNLELPAGQLRNRDQVMSVRLERVLKTVEDFSRVVVRYDEQGSPIYLSDIAHIYDGAKTENSLFKSNGLNALGFAISAQSDANPINVAKGVRALIDQIQPQLPDGMELEVAYDATIFIERSINEVYQTLFVTAALVVAVLYLFLGQARATLIPAVTVPVSLIAAFMVAQFAGFSLNILTLMALILAIGLVVDDAIVVVENIFKHLERGSSPLVAAYQGTREVGFAVIATTAVLVMIFLPIAFAGGMVGKFFTEFAVTLAVAVIFSSLIALTLTPVMGASLLKANVKPNRFNSAVNRQFARLESAYKRSLERALRFKWAGPTIIVMALVAVALLFPRINTEFTPSEDRGVLFVFVKGAEGTAFDRMVKNMEAVEARLLPLMSEEGPLQAMNLSTPAFGNRGDQTGFFVLLLKDWAVRDQHSNEILAQLRRDLSGIPDVRVFPMAPGFGGGSSEPVQFVLGGADYDELDRWAHAIIDATAARSEVRDLDSDFSQTTPELLAKVDLEAAARVGISPRDIARTLEAVLGGISRTTFVDRGEEYDVYLRGDIERFDDASKLSGIYMTTPAGERVTMASLVEFEEIGSASRLKRYQRTKSVTIQGYVGQGHTLGEALALLEQTAREMLPPDITIDYKGESKDYKENQADTFLVFALALMVAYLVLAAQFESFINPAVIMLTVPMGIVGALLGLLLTGESLNLYSQVGMIMLIGMVTKNGILIVEFANQLRDKGVAFEQAVVEGASARLRPILMTAFTTLFGAVPLLLATGAGAESRYAIGVVIFFGMALATVITLYLVPLMYRLMARSTHSPEHRTHELEEALAAEAARR
ncbi:efflux RND transporter permease subunit [Ferrimonas balearica]|uniref:efflux RND transporter permease subunit n=1 Tax=Ferrimonas balearica TaxID=44012 RepID=UPI001C99AC2A|nr:efflux RND transporter permease subunit [Ferrimonas balearica]MBY5921052.1 efflux RND transporter permease subunit [Ferrimonas balearica]MBY5996263.1 efflux RND transporter permease subunit [Ferrimonas balearica]